MDRSDSVYTFSFTTDWFHTVNAVAALSAPATAARRRGSRAGTQLRIQRSPTRNQHPAAIALVTAASRLIRSAYAAASGNRPQVWAISVNNGLPGRNSTRLNSTERLKTYAAFCMRPKNLFSG